MKKQTREIIGWREWVKLPDLGIKTIKAKTDTGAKTSSIHAVDIEYFKKGRRPWVKFKVHPEQRNSKKTIVCKAPLLEKRRVKSSNGQVQERPVITTKIHLGIVSWDIELTLTDRSSMGFRMLLGRDGLKKLFLVDVAKSYLGEKMRKRKEAS